MATIPLGNFGNAILKPGPRVEQVAGAFDKGGVLLFVHAYNTSFSAAAGRAACPRARR